MLICLIKSFLLKTHFSKLRDKHKLCIAWISLSAFGFLFDSDEFPTANVRRNENSLSEQNHFKNKRMTLPLRISYQQGAWHVAIQLTWGSLVKVQQIFQSSVNLGQSSQDFKKSLNLQSNLIQDSFITTWGIRMSITKVIKIPSSPAGSYNHQQNNRQLKLLKNLFLSRMKTLILKTSKDWDTPNFWPLTE